MKTVKRTYKDSLFRDIFHDEVRLAELSAGLLGEVVEFSDIQLTTLDWTFFTGIRNDVGFLVKDCHIVLLEHQSTLNKNMPLRLLMYIAELYRQYVDDDAVYRLARIPLPAPRFYVLYNGEEEIYCTQGCGHAERRDGVKPWQSTVPMKMIPGKANPFSCTDPEAGNCRCV